ncbi:putative membrane protein YphA (DoxX/SURF4 family) [Silvibacterium bohemicum]|uniref:Putative membrane protein YphA (DoxX/SURF4 family) n=2 Tax=Silvibacterium bohemicum TaxID=1577686 RepID=A0A841JZN0_9BACT|nr:hypothetical protein [Silvibacterium bohemicum]MBB6144421.1 putative membrane protein YphA (DoxX/SURF4 family) [Silvibacterium bohemicum]
MLRKIVLIVIKVLVCLNLFYGAFFFKFPGVPFSIALFTTMSDAVHGIISQPVFRIGAGLFETIGPILFLIPRTARFGAAFIATYMIGVLMSHIFVLGYGMAFVDALITFLLPCLYLYMTRPGHAKRYAD